MRVLLAVLMLLLLSAGYGWAGGIYPLGKPEVPGRREALDERGRHIGRIDGQPDALGRQEVLDERGRRIGQADKPGILGRREMRDERGRHLGQIQTPVVKPNANDDHRRHIDQVNRFNNLGRYKGK